MSAQVAADLRVGDVVEYRRDHWPEGSFVRGPVEQDGPDSPMYVLKGHFGIAEADGSPYAQLDGTLTVISRVPRPLYVNHPRTEPVVGDVIRHEEQSWVFDQDQDWTCGGGVYRKTEQFTLPLALLVDGETGQVVQ